MVVIIIAALCVIYNILYIAHSIRGRRFAPVVGLAVLIALIAVGTVAIQLHK